MLGACLGCRWGVSTVRHRSGIAAAAIGEGQPLFMELLPRNVRKRMAAFGHKQTLTAINICHFLSD